MRRKILETFGRTKQVAAARAAAAEGALRYERCTSFEARQLVDVACEAWTYSTNSKVRLILCRRHGPRNSNDEDSSQLVFQS